MTVAKPEAEPLRHQMVAASTWQTGPNVSVLDKPLHRRREAPAEVQPKLLKVSNALHDDDAMAYRAHSHLDRFAMVG
jgi:hypothetical protein